MFFGSGRAGGCEQPSCACLEGSEGQLRSRIEGMRIYDSVEENGGIYSVV